jgi:N-methylhydantoinase A
MDDEEVELVNIRVNSLGIIEKPKLTTQTKGGNKPPAGALMDYRQVFFEAKGAFVETPIYDRSKLLSGNKIPGPVIIEQYDTTTVIPSGWQATVDTFGLLQLIRK